MEWEFRFVNMPSGNGGDDWMELREVYYNDDGSLMGHADPCPGSETVGGIKQLAQWWLRASELPVLHEKDFPSDAWVISEVTGDDTDLGYEDCAHEVLTAFDAYADEDGD